MSTFLLFGGIFFFVGFAITAAFTGFSLYIPGAGINFFILFPASFNAVKGYTNKCPYCGGYIDA